MTGAQLYEMLKQQFCGAGARRILLPSATVEYTWDPALAPALNTPCASAGTPVVAGSLKIDGVPVDTAATYRITPALPEFRRSWKALVAPMINDRPVITR